MPVLEPAGERPAPAVEGLQEGPHEPRQPGVDGLAADLELALQALDHLLPQALGVPSPAALLGDALTHTAEGQLAPRSPLGVGTAISSRLTPSSRRPNARPRSSPEGPSFPGFSPGPPIKSRSAIPVLSITWVWTLRVLLPMGVVCRYATRGRPAPVRGRGRQRRCCSWCSPCSPDQLLPHLGSSPVVGNTALVCYQAGLPRRVRLRHPAPPPSPAGGTAPDPLTRRWYAPPSRYATRSGSRPQHPAAWLAGTLAVSIGALYVAVAGSSPCFRAGSPPAAGVARPIPTRCTP